MSTITVTYQAQDAKPQTFTIDGDKHEIGSILERCRKRIFPEVEPPALDEVWERAMARKRNNAAELPSEAAQAHREHAPPVGVRETSKQALAKHRGSGKLTAQQAVIVAWLRAHRGQEHTRQELSKALGLGINVVCGRVNELLNEPICALVETSKRR